jgi:hypothetical protein
MVRIDWPSARAGKQGQRGVHLLDLVEGLKKKISVTGVDEIQQERWNDCGTLVGLLASNGLEANDRHNHLRFVNLFLQLVRQRRQPGFDYIFLWTQQQGGFAVESNQLV